jgi:hypothetical protein
MRSLVTLTFGAIVALLTVAGCEVVTDSTDLPYTPHLVVYGLLTTDDSAVTVEIRKTLPLSDIYHDENAWIPDAQVSIVVEGISYTLQHTFGPYYSSDRLRIEPGKRYTLNVEWNGLHTSGSTVVPTPSPIDTGRFEVTLDDFGYPRATIWLMTHVDRPVALLGTYEYQRKLSTWDSIQMAKDPRYVPDTAWHVNNVYYNETSLATASAIDSVSFSAYGELYSNENYRAVLYTYDPSFYEFARTYDRYSDDSPFGTGGTNPNWNLDADGIGLFVGVSVTHRDFLWR